MKQCRYPVILNEVKNLIVIKDKPTEEILHFVQNDKGERNLFRIFLFQKKCFTLQKELQEDISAFQFTGNMYIDIKTNALVYLHYELLPGERDFVFDKRGFWQKTIKAEGKIMLEVQNGYYYPSFVISKISGMIDVLDGNSIPDHKDAFHIESVYNFFTMATEINPKVFISDNFPISYLMSNPFPDRTDYKNNFVLETEQEKQLFNFLK